MTDTYSSRLRLAKQQTATNRLVWGTILNAAFIDLLDEAIAGFTEIDVTSGNVTLTTENGTTDQARHMVLSVIGTPVAARSIIVPTLQKIYAIENLCGQSLTVKTADGSGVVIANGTRATVFVDEATDDVYHPTSHPSQTVLANTSDMLSIPCTVADATGGITNPTLWSHREGDMVVIEFPSIADVIVAATTFVINGTFPIDATPRSFSTYVRETGVIYKAFLTFTPTAITITKADGTAWANPGTRAIFAHNFTFRIDE